MENLKENLEQIVGKENVIADRVDLLCYSNEMSPFKYEPDLLVFAKTTQEVSRILQYANKRKIPVTPRGAGTSVVGAVLPKKRGIILDLTKMDKIQTIKTEDLYAIVEPGVVLDKLNKNLAKHGLFFPPDPGSSAACTIGGMAATNASGVRAVKYGTTKDWILALEIVLVDGTIFKAGHPVPKSSSGYNLVQLFVGSQGTLGIITELTLKVAPLPRYRATISVFFDTLENAGRSVTDILLAGVKPAAMELMDKNCQIAVNKVFILNLPETEGLLIIELDGNEKAVKEDIKAVEEICMKRNGKNFAWIDDPEKAEKLWKARKGLVPSMAKLREGYVIMVLAEDPGLPISKLKDVIREIQNISRKYGITMATFGHAGDGNVHPTMIVDPGSSEDWKKVKLVEKELMNLVLKHGGSISAEHGIGLSKIPFAKAGLGVSLEVMKRIKKTLDPNNILNPGKLGLDTGEREEPRNLFYEGLAHIGEEFELKRYKNEILKCFRCGICRAVCPTFNYTKLETTNARGRVLLAYFFLTKEIKPSEKLLEAFNKCTLCMHCTMACPPGIVVSEIVETARRDMVKMGFTDPVHKAIAENIMKHNNPFGLDAAQRLELAKTLEVL